MAKLITAAEIAQALPKETARSNEIEARVRAIIADVRAEGDAALLRYTQQWDASGATEAADLRLVAPAGGCAPQTQQALLQAAARIMEYHQRQLPADQFYTDQAGVELGWKWTPIQRVGLYVPGGKAAYPSSVLMNAIPARAAGVKELVMAVPTPRGEISRAMLEAAQIAGITEIYAIGGAQAVAALAYGTQTIRPVDKIVGPGNAYVAEAKRQVFGQVGIDMIAGPSEVLVIADENANPDWIAADLLSQAEHDEEARAILVSPSRGLLEAVAEAVERLLPKLSRRAIAEKSWAENGLLILVGDLEEAADVANRIAPEHLELMVENPKALAEKITEAGAIFYGAYTPEAIGDYVAGPSHVLPTSGTARFSSGLSVFDFLKRSSLIHCPKAAYGAIAPAASALAAEEGLTAHRLSVDLRK